MKNLRQTVRELMVTTHLISPDLAAYNVAQMTDSELTWRFEMYVRIGAAKPGKAMGTELSVAGPKPRAGNLSPTRSSGLATMTAGLRHSTLFPAADRGKNWPNSARFGGRTTGSEVGGGP
jgi:hypothetical protein